MDNEFISFTISKQKNIALIAHDSKKKENAGVYNFLHMQDYDFCFCTHGTRLLDGFVYSITEVLKL